MGSSQHSEYVPPKSLPGATKHETVDNAKVRLATGVQDLKDLKTQIPIRRVRRESKQRRALLAAGCGALLIGGGVAWLLARTLGTETAATGAVASAQLKAPSALEQPARGTPADALAQSAPEQRRPAVTAVPSPSGTGSAEGRGDHGATAGQAPASPGDLASPSGVSASGHPSGRQAGQVAAAPGPPADSSQRISRPAGRTDAQPHVSGHSADRTTGRWDPLARRTAAPSGSSEKPAPKENQSAQPPSPATSRSQSPENQVWVKPTGRKVWLD